MTPEEASLRRILKAEETGAVDLDLSGLDLDGLPPDLAGLTSLQSLNLDFCSQIIDLSPLAGLTKLQSLNLSGCDQLSGDLSPLAGLTSLQALNMSYCRGRFAPLKSLLPTLEKLVLFACKFDDLPTEICGEFRENVWKKVRSHYKDLEMGQRIDAEIKVLFLGNGGVGKTQLCRRLRHLPFDPNIPSTHGIQLGQTAVTLENFPEPNGVWICAGSSSSETAKEETTTTG